MTFHEYIISNNNDIERKVAIIFYYLLFNSRLVKYDALMVEIFR